MVRMGPGMDSACALYSAQVREYSQQDVNSMAVGAPCQLDWQLGNDPGHI